MPLYVFHSAAVCVCLCLLLCTGICADKSRICRCAPFAPANKMDWRNRPRPTTSDWQPAERQKGSGTNGGFRMKKGNERRRRRRRRWRAPGYMSRFQTRHSKSPLLAALFSPMFFSSTHYWFGLIRFLLKGSQQSTDRHLFSISHSSPHSACQLTPPPPPVHVTHQQCDRHSQTVVNVQRGSGETWGLDEKNTINCPFFIRPF